MYTIFNLKSDLKNKRQLVMGSEHWGKCAWSFIYNVVLSHKGKIKHLKAFLVNLQYVLPCEKCKKHYSEFLTENPIPNKKHLIFQWCELLENEIAKENYKGEYIPIRRLDQILTPTVRSVPAVKNINSSTVAEEVPKASKATTQVLKSGGDCINCNKDRMKKSLQNVSMLNMGAPVSNNYEKPLWYSRRI